MLEQYLIISKIVKLLVSHTHNKNTKQPNKLTKMQIERVIFLFGLINGDNNFLVLFLGLKKKR